MSTVAGEQSGVLPRGYVIVATTIGSALEFYDFTVYSFFSLIIGELYFPEVAPANRFLASIAVFGVGFLMRPLGGIVFGAYADTVGRKKAMVLTMMLMSASCALMTVLPTYGTIGAAAPLLLMGARLLQGFAAGGEFGPGTTFLMEYATPKTRAFFSSWNFAAQSLGVAMGALTATLAHVFLSRAEMVSWGWRLPFALGIFVAPIGMFIRRRLDETLEVRKGGSTARHSVRVVKEVLTKHLRLTILGTFAELGGSVSTHATAFFLPSYAARQLGIDPTYASASGIVVAMAIFVASPMMGLLAERITRKRLLIICRVAMIALVYPLLLWLKTEPNPAVLFAVAAILSVLVAGQVVPVNVMIPEAFPQSVRATAIAMTFVVSASLFGGFTPFIAGLLVKLSGNDLAPAWYVSAACLIALLPFIWLKDRTHDNIE